MNPHAAHTDELACVGCGEMKPRMDLDRLLWCEGCRTRARARAARRGWLVGLVVAVALSLWIWFYVQPSDLVIGGWIGTVLAALYVSHRVAREVFYTVERVRRPPPGSGISTGGP